MMPTMGDVIDLLARPTYGMAQVDRVLGLRSGTSRRWIDGYERRGRRYPPVVRDTTSGDDVVTWGEFVETRLLAEFRDAGVPIYRMRPAVEQLREELGTPYPLASARTWLDAQGQELVLRVQEAVGLESQLSLVVVRSGQRVLEWSESARDFKDSAEWHDTPLGRQIQRLLPESSIDGVVLDPLVSFGEPTIRGRGIRTEVLAELLRAGETLDGIAEMYELSRSQVGAAIRYELIRSQPA